MNNNVDQNTTTTTYTGVVYSYTNTTAGDEYGYRYIGTTSNEYVRKSLWNSSKTERYAGDKVNGARKRYGIASFKYEILATIQCSDPEELKIELAKVKHQLHLTEMERDLLKKLEEIERRDASQK